VFRTSPLALLGAVALTVPPFSSPALADTPDGVEVLGRGPVHEAFAQPVADQPEPGPIVPKEPPAKIDEAPPEQKPPGDNVRWVPGYWQWDDEKQEFTWVSGFWRKTPPGRTWVPGRYVKKGDGWQWVAGYWQDAAQKDAPLLPEPPAPRTTDSSDPPRLDSLYVPGVWLYINSRYCWRPAYYTDYRPGWVWHPAQYVWTPDGYVFVDGYWDYPLDERGTLFAPVAIDPATLARPGFCYTPAYCVNYDFLPTALFVRPRYRHYYFGDYYGKGYARLGYTPWFDVRVGGRGYDPLYAYLRHAPPAQGWDRELRAVHTGRTSGDLVLPPRTLSQQQALVRKVTVDKSVKVTNLKQVTPLVAPADRPAPTQNAIRSAGRQPEQMTIVIGTRTVSPATDHPHTTTTVTPHPTAPAHRLEIVTPAPAPVHVNPAQVVPAHTTQAHAVPAHTTQAHAAPVHVAPARPAPVHVAPAHAAPAHSAPAHSAPTHASSSHHSGGGHRR
jgi:hypothetical protein